MSFHAFCARLARAATLAGLAVPALASAAGVWHYTLGHERAEQQAQFCHDETEVRALAGIFRDKGARPGYFAMKQLFACTTRVATFTPLEIIESVVIETRTTGGYAVHFVRVRVQGGGTQYLITTRDVALP